MKQSYQRDSYLDSIKTILIFLVVFGHCIVRLGERTPIINTTFNMIYLIHMPLFVFVSGVCFNTSKNWKDVVKRCIELLATFLLYQFVWSVLDRPYGLSKWLSPAVTLWYLLSLVYWRVSLYWLARLTNRKSWWLIIALLLGVCAGFIPINTEFSFQRTFAFFPFFVIGNMYRGIKITGGGKLVKIALFCIMLFFFIFSYYCFSDSQLRWLLCSMQNYFSWPVALIKAPIYRFGWYLLAILLSFCFLYVVPDRKYLSVHGGKSLTIYLLHFFPIWVLQKKFGFKTDNLLLLLGLALFIFIVTQYMHRWRIIQKLIKPIQFK